MDVKKVFAKHISFTKERFFTRYRKLSENEPYHVLLESGRGGRYSIAGIRPFAIIRAKKDGVDIQTKNETLHIAGKPLRAMKKWMEQFTIKPAPNLPDFQGGAIGYISYDYVRHIETLPKIALDDLQLPLLYFLVFKEWAIFDHQKNCLSIVLLDDEKKAEKARRKLESLTNQWLDEEDTVEMIPTNKEKEAMTEVSFSENEFQQAVEKIQAYIAQGDVYQVNLTVRQMKQLGVPPLHVYEELRKLNPSPYMSYLHTPEFQLVSSSPELLVKKKKQSVHTRPIAGTRKRGLSVEEDVRLAKELIENKKEQAEHMMVIDLERNDLGKVCAYGTVEVDEWMAIEKYSHVMHIVSNIRGKLREEKDGYDLIEAMFPGGTITGAPKIRTMEIIEELEPVRRGIYTGSIGWIGFQGDLELNIVIRTMIVHEGKAYVQAGAGIVHDSSPKSEYVESIAKAEALWNAKEAAERRKVRGLDH